MYTPIWMCSIRLWLKEPLSRRTRRQSRKLAGPHLYGRPRLEALEDRITPTTLEVSGAAGLQNAIAQVNSDSTNDTIILDPGAYSLGAQLGITKAQGSLTIEGNSTSASGAILDGQGQNRVFVIDSGISVTFQNLTIQHGYATTDITGQSTNAAEGGGILAVGGGSIALTNVVVQSNTAQAFSGGGPQSFGGGLYVDGGSLTITSSVIQNNHAYGSYGATNLGGIAYGGGVYFNADNNTSAVLTITNTTVNGNIAQAGSGIPGGIAEGGGIYAFGATTNSTAISIGGSTLLYNEAIGGTGADQAAAGGFAEGGGAFLAGGGLDGLVNSTIADNSALYGVGVYNGSIPSSGGGLYYAGSDIAVVYTTIAYNYAVDYFTGTGAPDMGGGIGGSANSSVVLTNTLLASNTAPTTPDYSPGVVTSNGGNVIGVANNNSDFSFTSDQFGSAANPLNPGIAPTPGLGNNGGPTQTIALLPGSPAIGNAENLFSTSTGGIDQRGAPYVRVYNNISDTGAYEYTQAPASPATVSITGSLSGSPLTYSLSSQGVNVTATVSINGTPASGGSVSFALVQNGQVLPGSATSPQPVSSNGSTGNVTLTVPGGVKAGTYNLQATYTDANNNSYSPVTISAATLTISPVPTTLVVGANSATSQGVTAATVLLFSSNFPTVNEGSVQFTLTNSSGVTVGTGTASLVNGGAGPVTLGSNLAPGNYTLAATYSDTEGNFQGSSATPVTATVPPSGGGGGGGGGGGSPAPPWTPPSLNVPPLLAFIDSLLGGSETVNYANETEAIVDSIFGFPLLVSTFNSSGNLVSVTLLGFNVTFFFG